MSDGTWEVREVSGYGSSRYTIEARTDDNRNHVMLLVEDEKDARQLVYKLDRCVREILVKRS